MQRYFKNLNIWKWKVQYFICKYSKSKRLTIDGIWKKFSNKQHYGNFHQNFKTWEVQFRYQKYCKLMNISTFRYILCQPLVLKSVHQASSCSEAILLCLEQFHTRSSVSNSSSQWDQCHSQSEGTLRRSHSSHILHSDND